MRWSHLIHVIVSMFLIGNSANAMEFYQPNKMGRVTYNDKDRNFRVIVNQSDSGNKVIEQFDTQTVRGLAKFRHGNFVLYVHYDTMVPSTSFGGYMAMNTVQISPGDVEVSRVSSDGIRDKEFTLYLIQEKGEQYDECVIIGTKRSEMQYAKYADTRELSKKFFGKVKTPIKFTSLYSERNNIALRYKYPNHPNTDGEIRFCWDEKHQKFQPKNIIYDEKMKILELLDEYVKKLNFRDRRNGLDYIQNVRIYDTKVDVYEDKAVVIYNWEKLYGYYICSNSVPRTAKGQTRQNWIKTSENGWKMENARIELITEGFMPPRPQLFIKRRK